MEFAMTEKIVRSVTAHSVATSDVTKNAVNPRNSFIDRDKATLADPVIEMDASETKDKTLFAFLESQPIETGAAPSYPSIVDHFDTRSGLVEGKKHIQDNRQKLTLENPTDNDQFVASMPLRYKAQDMAARTLAAWCASQPAFSQVLHPALTSSPGHAYWQQLCVTPLEPEGLAAGIFSVVMDARFPAHQVDEFCDSLKLFKIGYSWGGPMSLVMPYNMSSSRQRSTEHMQHGRVVRFCIGLEDVNDLQRDILQALQQANLQT
jgi:hypothetical protein